MSEECATVHRIAGNLPRHGFPFDESLIPSNGIYVLLRKERWDMIRIEL
jgi:hypothetical protein